MYRIPTLCPSQVNKIAYYVIHLFIIYFHFLYMIQKCSKKLGKSGKIGLTWGAVAPITFIPISYSVRLSRFQLLRGYSGTN